MRTITIIAILLGLNTVSFAQLHVSPTTTDGSFIYVSDTYIYVENDVDLQSNATASSTATNQFSNIILRNQGQLLQGNGSSQDNDGSGDLSVYQEGTHFSTEFNFWHSPVGIAQDTESGSLTTLAPGNTHFAFRPSGQNLFVPTTLGRSNQALIMPTSTLDGTTSNGSLLSIASFWLFKFTGGSTTAEFVPIQDTGIAEVGYGFTMKGINGTDNTTINGVQNNPGGNQRYDFRGRPNNGTITVPIADHNVLPGEDVLPDNVLTGNPYPSALDLSYFLIENSATGPVNYTDATGTIITINGRETLDGSAYFWDQRPVGTHFIEGYQGGYGTFIPVELGSTGMYVPPTFDMFDADGNSLGGDFGTGNSVERRFSPISQGFFVVSIVNPAEENFIITNNHRAFVKEGAANSSEFRNAESVNQNILSTSSTNPTDTNPDIKGIGISYNFEDLSPVPQMRLTAEIDDTYIRQLAVGLNPNATQEFDLFMDGRSLSEVGTENGDLAADVGFSITDKDERFLINMIDSPQGAILPLSVETLFQTTFIFYVQGFQDFGHDEVYLFDAQTGVYHDIINNKAEYILDAGLYDDRFFITFEKNATRSGEPISKEDTKEIEQRLQVFNAINARQNNNAQLLEVINPEQAELVNVELYDVSGKRIFNRQNLGNNQSYTFPTNNLATGIYIVRMQTQDGLTKARKVSINN